MLLAHSYHYCFRMNDFCTYLTKLYIFNFSRMISVSIREKPFRLLRTKLHFHSIVTFILLIAHLSFVTRLPGNEIRAFHPPNIEQRPSSTLVVSCFQRQEERNCEMLSIICIIQTVNSIGCHRGWRVLDTPPLSMAPLQWS